MFSDLVGSTALANEIDPEDLRALIQRYQDVCAGAIARYDGFIAKFMGDGVLAYFGYPQAQEDAAERSVHAALAIIEGLKKLKDADHRELATRIGIATGLVVIGDIVGTGAAREHSIAGETPNLAARLQTLAEPNSILVSENTYRLLGRQFEYQNLGTHALKGFTEQVKVWRVLRESAVASRFAAARATTAGPFIGRAEELALLLDRWRSAKKGKGQVVLLSGEAGIGKSRIVDALIERIANDSYYHLTFQCSPYHINSALHPVIRQFERSAGLVADDSAATKLTKLEEVLRATNNLDDATRNLFADLLGIPLDENYPKLDLSPIQRKAATIAAIAHQLMQLAAQKPVLFVLEDVHWIDPTTQELITSLIGNIVSARVLVLITGRPEFVPPWSARDHLTSLMLNRLSKTQCVELVTGIAAAKMLERDVVDDITAKTDGVPLFVEELTKTVMESAAPDRRRVPATLQDSLMARLDRLGPAKEIAQTAAVIGQQFSYKLLKRISSLGEIELTAAMSRLVEAGLAFAQSDGNDASYSFKHALLRDVAYDNLLRTRRREIHERVARALQEDFPTLVESEPELLAQHFAQAALADQACIYYERAADRAAARSNFAEAVANLNAGIAEAAKLAEAPNRPRRELDLLIKLGAPLTIMKGPQSVEVEQVYERARAAAESLGDEPAMFKATWGLWYSANIGRKLEKARDRAQDLVTLGQRAADQDLLLEAFHCRWSTAFFRGDTATALKDSQEGIERYDSAKHSWMGPVFGGHDPGVCAHGVQADALCFAGVFSRAAKRIDEAILLSEKLNHPHSLGHALLNATLSHQLSGNLAEVAGYAGRMFELADKYNFPPLRAHSVMVSGWARVVGENSEAALEAMEAEFPRASAIGPLFRFYGALLAEARARFGKFSEALNVLQWAIDTVTEPGVGFILPELYRLKGVCLLRLDSTNQNEAINSLQMAIDTARQQKAPLFELKAAINMAQSASSMGLSHNRLQSLRDCYADLSEDFDAAKRAQAREILAALN